MTDQSASSSIRGDRALTDGDLDRLGFGEVAVRIASSLADHASDNGFVVGVNGRWGSGKSSLLYLILAELFKIRGPNGPTIVRFQPWLIGNRDALLAALFDQLATAVATASQSDSDATAETVRKAKAAAKRIRKFAKSISKAGDLLQAVPGGSVTQAIGKGLSAFARLFSDGESPSLAVQKDKLIKSLRDLSHRFIVTIDDVDRLDPAEVVEVLRLIRSVADFPNIIYLLCYDGEVLAANVKLGANVPDGAAYLEKIVQLTVMVPLPEPFQLRQWFGDEIIRLTGVLSESVKSRLRTVVDQEGGKRLRTPRAVVRTLDSFRFFWPALKSERVDLPDLIWLLLVKDAEPKLYRWVETYLANIAIKTTGIGSLSDEGKAQELEELRAILVDGNNNDVGYRHFLIEQLPGFELDYGNDGPGLKIYERVDNDRRDSAIAGRRLASPDHYRLYLALTGPSHAITQAETENLFETLNVEPLTASEALASLAYQRISPELSKLDLFLERLSESQIEALLPEQAMNLLIVLSDSLDGFDAPGSDQSFMLFTTWDRAQKIVRPLLQRVGPENRQLVIDRMFEKGLALGWLSNLLRSETFAHGRYGDRQKPEGERILTVAEFDHVADAMVARYRALPVSQLLSRTRPLNTLFAWAQAGDEDGPKKALRLEIRSDRGLIRVLGAFITTASSSDLGTYEYISRENVSYFFDYDNARDRALETDGKGWPDDERARLIRVQAALNIGRDRSFAEAG